MREKWIKISWFSNLYRIKMNKKFIFLFLNIYNYIIYREPARDFNRMAAMALGMRHTSTQSTQMWQRKRLNGVEWLIERNVSRELYTTYARFPIQFIIPTIKPYLVLTHTHARAHEMHTLETGLSSIFAVRSAEETSSTFKFFDH